MRGERGYRGRLLTRSLGPLDPDLGGRRERELTGLEAHERGGCLAGRPTYGMRQQREDASPYIPSIAARLRD